MIRVENLCKEFYMHIRDDAQIEGFENINLHIEPGTLTAITGPSGCGKSSLLKCIYRTYTPTGGNVWYKKADGTSINLATAEPWEIIALRKEEIGYVSQFFSVIPRISALDILINTQTAHGVAQEVARKKAKEYLKCVGIGEHLWNMYPATFSGGEKQRIILVQSVKHVECAQNIVVVSTLSGMAQAAASVLDCMKIKEIVGSIAGDDTIMCVTKTNDSAKAVYDKIKSLL